MDNTKNDEYYLDKIRHCFLRIMEKMDNVSYDAFCKDVDIQEITMFNLIQISENVRNLSDNYKKSHENIPWLEIYGLRNRIVHDYGNVILDIVYETLKNDIPSLYKTIY